MKKITFLLILLTVSLGYAQQQQYDLGFEPGDPDGDISNWVAFEPTTPAAEIVTNPMPNGTNTSATTKVLKLKVLQAGDCFAGATNFHGTLGTWELDGAVPSNLTLSMDVNRSTTVGVVGIKFANSSDGTVFEINDSQGQVSAANTWETLTWDISVGSNMNGQNMNIDQMVIFIDFTCPLDNRPADVDLLVDNISWGANKLTDPVMPSCSDGIQNQDETGIDCGGATCPSCPPAGSTGLPYDFESSPVSGDFTSFDGGGASVEAVAAPQSTGNTSSNLAKLVRDGGQVWAGAYLDLDAALNFTTEKFITLRVWTDAPIGTPMNLKVEQQSNRGNSLELGTVTTVTGGWETLSWDFSAAGASVFDSLVFLFDIGNLGNGTATSTFYFDDVQQVSTLGIKDNDLTSFNVYPNPTQDRWNIKADTENISKINVFDVLGKQVLSLSPNSREAIINGSNLKSGLYFAKIKTDNSTSSIKLIKK